MMFFVYSQVLIQQIKLVFALSTIIKLIKQPAFKFADESPYDFEHLILLALPPPPPVHTARERVFL